jgi:hypothetical protein
MPSGVKNPALRQAEDAARPAHGIAVHGIFSRSSGPPPPSFCMRVIHAPIVI